MGETATYPGGTRRRRSPAITIALLLVTDWPMMNEAINLLLASCDPCDCMTRVKVNKQG
jgi:hypothetical protein